MVKSYIWLSKYLNSFTYDFGKGICAVSRVVNLMSKLECFSTDTTVPANNVLQKRFHDLSLSTEAFSSVQYVGTQTITPPTDFSELKEIITKQVKSTASRVPRQPDIVFSALQVTHPPSHSWFL